MTDKPAAPEPGDPFPENAAIARRVAATIKETNPDLAATLAAFRAAAPAPHPMRIGPSSGFHNISTLTACPWAAPAPDKEKP